MASLFDTMGIKFKFDEGVSMVTVGRLTMYRTDHQGIILDQRSVLFPPEVDVKKEMASFKEELTNRIQQQPNLGKIVAYSPEIGIDVQIGNSDEYFMIRPASSIVYESEYEQMKGNFKTLLSHPLLLLKAPIK